jgi:hypothetical protein
MDSLKIHTIEIDNTDEQYDILNFRVEFPAPLENGILLSQIVTRAVEKNRSIIYVKKYFPTVRLVYKSQDIDPLKESTRNLNIYSVCVQGLVRGELTNFVLAGISPSKEKVEILVFKQGWRMIGNHPHVLNMGTVYDWKSSLDFDLCHGECVEPWWCEDKYKDTHKVLVAA